MKANSSHQIGLTLIELLIVMAIIAFLIAVAMPNFVKARGLSQRNACISNLKQIDVAKSTWALENKKPDTASPNNSDLFGPTGYIPQQPACPANGTYTLDIIARKPSCSFAISEGHTL